MLRQRDDDARRPAIGTHGVVLLDVFGEPGVVLQPPQRGLRNQQEVGATLPQPLQLRDARITVRRMMSGVGAVLALWKMPAAAISEPEELVVTLAEDQHGGPGRSGVVHQLTHARDQRIVVRPCPPGMRRPWHLPLLLPPLPIGMEQVAILTGLGQPSYRRLAEVMDEHILGARDAEPRCPDPHRQVVIFEESDVKPGVERPGRVPYRAPQRGTEQRGGTDVERLTREAARVLTRKLLELTVGAIRHADFGLVAGAVRGCPDETDPFIAEVRDQPVQPAVDRNGVIVEKDDDVGARQRGATIRRFGKAGVGRHTDRFALVRPAARERAGNPACHRWTRCPRR